MKDYYHTERIAQRIFRINSDEGVFTHLFVGDQKALLLDTSYGFGDLKSFVRSITDLPLIVLASHGHLDHTCGNYQFSEDIFIDRKDIELCKAHNSKASRRQAIENGKHTFNFITGKTQDIIPNDFDENAYIEKGYGTLVPIDDGHVFDLGNLTLIVHELPGHTHGSIGVEYVEEKLLFTGDAINHSTWLFLPESTGIGTYIESILKAKSLDIEAIIYSHNPVVSPKSVLDDFLDCAQHADYYSGTPYESFLSGDMEPRICVRPGYKPADYMRAGFAAIVIGKPSK